MATWTHSSLFGGLPGKSAMSELITLTAQHDDPHHLSTTIALDYKEAFARLSPFTCIAILEILGLPKAIADVLRDMYATLTRWVRVGMAASSSFSANHTGIIEGCAMSVALINGLMHVWASWITSQLPDLHLGVFLDDRPVHDLGVVRHLVQGLGALSTL